MARPKKNKQILFPELYSIPVYGVPPPLSWQECLAILGELEAGQFYRAAELMDGMLRDDRVRAVLHLRIYGVLGAPKEFIPANKSKKAKKIAKEIEENFQKILPDDQVFEVMMNGIMQGMGHGTLDWQRTDEKWMPRLRAWHNRNARFQWLMTDDEPQTMQEKVGTYRTITMNEGEQVVEPNTGQWLLYTPYGYLYSYLRGALRAIVSPWLARTLCRFYWARYSEVHGLPMRGIVMPASAPEDAQRKFVSQFRNIGSQSVIRLPKLENGEEFDVKLIEASATSYTGFNMWIEECNREISIALLGQAMSTDGSKGAFASQHAGEDVRLEVKQMDRGIADVLREQVLEWYCLYNYGDKSLAPKIIYRVEPPEELRDITQQYLQFAQAVQTLLNTGADVDYEALFNKVGIPLNINNTEATNIINKPSQQAEPSESPQEQATEQDSSTKEPT